MKKNVGDVVATKAEARLLLTEGYILRDEDEHEWGVDPDGTLFFKTPSGRKERQRYGFDSGTWSAGTDGPFVIVSPPAAPDGMPWPEACALLEAGETVQAHDKTLDRWFDVRLVRGVPVTFNDTGGNFGPTSSYRVLSKMRWRQKPTPKALTLAQAVEEIRDLRAATEEAQSQADLDRVLEILSRVTE